MPGKPISVVHLVAGLGAGGAEKQLFLLCSYAPEDVHHTVVSIRGGGWAERLRTAGIAVHTLDEESIAGLRTIVRVALILRKLRPAILHCWLPSMSVVGALAARLSGVRHLRVIASIRNVDDWMPRWRIILQKWVARYWDLALCNSFGGFDWGIRAGLPADKLRVIPNGIERSSPRTEDEYCAARQALGLTQESFVVACANRLVPQKRMDRVVDAARQLPEYTFLVAGAGPQMDWLNTNRPDNFHLLGHMDSTRPLLAASDIFLMTSDREGTSNSLLEAMQSGCAVVATPAGDNARIMAGGAGVVTSPDRIAETIRQLRHDARSRADMGAKAAQRAWEFSTDRMVERTADAYRELTGRAPSPGRTRVLYLDYTNNIGLGGGQRSLLLLLRNLDRSRYKPMVACPPDERLLDFVEPDVDVRSLVLPRQFRSLSRRRAGFIGSVLGSFACVPAILRLRRIIIREHVGLIHANNLKMLLLAAAAAWGTRVPIVWHLRDILPDRAVVKVIRAIAARLADSVLAVSHAVAAPFGARANVRVFYNAVEMPPGGRKNRRRGWRVRHGIQEDAFVVGYAGRLDSAKGLKVLAGALASADRKIPGSLWLLVAGEGPERPVIEQELRRAGLLERTIFVGFQEELHDAWAAMDAAVTPSIEPDSFPRSVIEAMSHGLPVIGSDVGGIAEAIEHGESGFCVPAADCLALSRALETLAENRPLARRMGENGRARCQERFAARRQAEALSELYEDLLASRGGS